MLQPPGGVWPVCRMDKILRCKYRLFLCAAWHGRCLGLHGRRRVDAGDTGLYGEKESLFMLRKRLRRAVFRSAARLRLARLRLARLRLNRLRPPSAAAPVLRPRRKTCRNSAGRCPLQRRPALEQAGQCGRPCAAAVCRGPERKPGAILQNLGVSKWMRRFP